MVAISPYRMLKAPIFFVETGAGNISVAEDSRANSSTSRKSGSLTAQRICAVAWSFKRSKAAVDISGLRGFASGKTEIGLDSSCARMSGSFTTRRSSRAASGEISLTLAARFRGRSRFEIRTGQGRVRISDSQGHGPGRRIRALERVGSASKLPTYLRCFSNSGEY